jgi:hypothetical protein
MITPRAEALLRACEKHALFLAGQIEAANTEAFLLEDLASLRAELQTKSRLKRALESGATRRGVWKPPHW